MWKVFPLVWTDTLWFDLWTQHLLECCCVSNVLYVISCQVISCLVCGTKLTTKKPGPTWPIGIHFWQCKVFLVIGSKRFFMCFHFHIEYYQLGPKGPWLTFLGSCPIGCRMWYSKGSLGSFPLLVKGVAEEVGIKPYICT